MRENQCRECKWYEAWKAQKGHCKRRAPWVEAQSGMTRWPMVDETNGCGDFAKRGASESYPAAERTYVHGLGSVSGQELEEHRRAGRVERLPLDLQHPEKLSFCLVDWWLETGTSESCASIVPERSSSTGTNDEA